MINRVTLIGYVGSAPEIRSFEGGGRMARIRMATTERVLQRKTNQWCDHTEWHTIILWGEMATLAEGSIDKGTQLYIEGALRSCKWQGKDGTEHHAVEIAASQMKILSRPKQSVVTQESPRKPAPDIAAPVDDIDDIPF